MLQKILRGGLAATAVLSGLLFAGPAHAASAAPRPTLVAVGTGSPQLESQRQATARAVAALSGKVTLAAEVHPTPCWENVSFQRYGLTKYVAMERDYKGDRQYELRARSSSVGPWELFTLCRDGWTEVTTIRSQSNWKYVAVEQAYGGTIYAMLRARTPEAELGPWELFRSDLVPGENHCGQIQAQVNGLYVSAEEDYKGDSAGMLRARTREADIGNWEDFCY